MSVHASGPTLADEHTVLRQAVAVRRRQVLDAFGTGRWPGVEIARLVDCLRGELLDQVGIEERSLFPRTPAGLYPERVRRLVDDHVRLRDLTVALAATVEPSAADRDPAAVVGLLDDLTETLDRHVRDEEEVLSPVTDTPIAGLRSHEWFPVTEGPLVEVDRLPRGVAVDAVIARLLHMRPGDVVEISSGACLGDLEESFRRRGMATEYGWAYDEEGPDRWRVRITRRATAG
jgi:hemerythrin-like domain-containing protein